MTEPIDPERAEMIAAQLAQALDRDDFTAAARLLDAECVYEKGSETLRGVEAIVDSYTASAVWAQRQFDEVRYESEVEPARGNEVAVRFTDYVMKVPGRWHRYRCRQVLTVGAGGRIVRIVHHELPGERESLEAFLKECGIER